jgi:uncharacterized membrane protein
MAIKPAHYHWTALAGFFGLFALLMLWNTLFSSSARLPVALVLLIAVTPLLLPMRGFLAGNRKSCAWMAYLSLPYFVHGAQEAYADADERLYAGLEIVFSLLLFFGSSLYIRFAGKAP